MCVGEMDNERESVFAFFRGEGGEKKEGDNRCAWQQTDNEKLQKKFYKRSTNSVAFCAIQ